MKNLLLLMLLMPWIALANPIDDRCPQFTAYGAPVGPDANTQYSCKQNYALKYSNGSKNAVYVVEHVTKESITGPAKRKDDFRPDPTLAAGTSAQLADYAGKPYDRGHLAPGADNTQTESIMSESFLLSNMIPQVPNNNRGIWKQLEVQVRDYVLKNNDVYVVSGPIYNTVYETIGAGVGIPQRIFKVIVDVKNQRASAYIFPNTALPVADLPKYKVTIREAEQASGLNFNPKLPLNAALETAKTW